MTPADDRLAPRDHPLDPDQRFYGPVIVAACTAVLVATSPGQTVVVSQFNESFRWALGLSATELSTAYLIGTVSAAVPLTLVGAVADRFGPRRVMFAVALLFGAVCFAMGHVQSLATLTLCFFGLRFLGQGSLGMLSGHILALWYERRLGSVNGIKMVFAQGGFALTPLLAIGLIQQLGWRAAYGVLGVLVWIVVLPLALFVVRDRPEDKGQRLDGEAVPQGAGEAVTADEEDGAFDLPQTLATRAFWILAGASVLSGFTGTALLFHAQPILVARDLAPEHSASLVMAWSLSVAALVVPVGYLADRRHPRGLLALSALLMAAAPALVIVSDSVLLLCAAMVLYGGAMAIASAVGVPTIARYFGRRHHGSIRGFLTFLAVAGTGLGPVVLGLSVDRTASFTTGLGLCVGLALTLAAATLTLQRPSPPALQQP